MNKQIPKIVWGMVAVSFVPILLILHPPTAVTLKSVSLYISAIAGYSGIILLLWMYVLGAKSAIGLVFKDLAQVLDIHKKLGKYASLAFLLHPLLIIYSYGESILYSFIPHIDTPFEQAVTLGRIAFMILVMIWVGSVLLREKIGFRPWKYLHYLAYISLPFALLHVPNIGSQYLAWPAVQSYYSAIVTLFVIFSIIRVSSLLNLDRKPYTVIKHTQITPYDFVLTLKPTGTYIEPRLGQYVHLKVGYISEDHPFSITHYDADTHEITLTYRVYGNYTKFLAKLTTGTEVALGGPYGLFTRSLLSDSADPVVYIAGGIGITPFVQRITDENGQREQWLFAANRTHAGAVNVNDMERIIGDRCVAIYSQEPAMQGEEYGRITEEIFTKYLKNPRAYSYYICGPQGFTAEAMRILRTLGVPKDKVYTEKFAW